MEADNFVRFLLMTKSVYESLAYQEAISSRRIATRALYFCVAQTLISFAGCVFGSNWLFRIKDSYEARLQAQQEASYSVFEQVLDELRIKDSYEARLQAQQEASYSVFEQVLDELGTPEEKKAETLMEYLETLRAEEAPDPAIAKPPAPDQ